MATEKTYPCVMPGGRIRELTAQQMHAEEWRRATNDMKITVLLARIETLKQEVQALKGASRG